MTTKVHAAVSGCGRLLKIVLTAGQCGDAPQAPALLADVQPGRVEHVLADAAYDSDAIRQQVKRLKARCCIRPNPTRKRKKRYQKSRYKNRNVIERFFRRLKEYRRVATRYEKKPANFAGFIWLAALLIQAF